MEELGRGNDSVPLEPFVHQVSGRSSFQQFDKYTVCKPLFSKELKFYQEMPSALKPFIPQFKGVLTAQLKEDRQGNAKLIVRPNRSMYSDNSNLPKDLSDSDDDMQDSWEWEYSRDHPSFERSKSNERKFQRYLILENVISRYHHPSVLDLKMGTETHSDYKTSKEEMQRRKSKWEKTTASTLGVRLGGMKVYLVNYGEFLYKNKSEGSELSERGFKDTLASFFYNGKTFRCELVDCFVKKLETFLQVMEKDLNSYRFYNSSLLLVYEGEVSKSNESASKACTTNTCGTRPSLVHNSYEQCSCTCSPEQMDMRMIDFAHVCHHRAATESSGSCSSSSYGPDRGYIFGLKSLIRILQNIQVEYHAKIRFKENHLNHQTDHVP